MHEHAPLPHDVVVEDLQIIRATLAVLSDDVRQASPSAADALHDARAKLVQAERALRKPAANR